MLSEVPPDAKAFKAFLASEDPIAIEKSTPLELRDIVFFVVPIITFHITITIVVILL